MAANTTLRLRQDFDKLSVPAGLLWRSSSEQQETADDNDLKDESPLKNEK
jgi:hypothetical protein